MVGQTTATDPVMLEILRNRFKAIAEEMASVTLRTGFTVFVKETSDFGACLAAPHGEIFAAPIDTAVSIMVGLPAWEAINAIPHYDDGDIGISNDPITTRGLSTHLPDIWLWKPIFVDGQIVAFGFNFIHSSDVGGRVPGSISPTNYEIFQEGLRIPPAKLYKRGELNRELLELILANCRIPDQNWGDIKAQVASLNTAERRMQEVAARYGRAAVVQGISDLLDHGEARARKLIGTIPNGRYIFADYMEGDVVGGRPIRIKLTLEVRDDEMHLDFSGTDLQVRAALNVPTWNQKGHYMFAFPMLNYFRTLEPDVPYNAGLIRPLYFNLPAGSLVNPEPTAAVGVRAATMFRVLDNISGCLTQAQPEVIPAASSGQVAIVLVSTLDSKTGERRISVAQPLSGGSGARPTLDGIDGASFTGGWLRNIPNEALEADMPVLVEQYGYRDGAIAPGEFRGGAGIHFRLRALTPETIMTARGMERYTFHPWGLRGGSAGEIGVATLNPNTPNAKNLGKIDILHLGPDDVVDFQSASGGGFGDPFKRDPNRVLADVHAGFIDVTAARVDYGVVITNDAVDLEATNALRASRPPAHRAADLFDVGPARRAYEARWPDETQTTMVDRLMAYPSALRYYLRDRLVAAVEARVAPDQPVTPEVVAATLAEIVGGLNRRPAVGAGLEVPR